MRLINKLILAGFFFAAISSCEKDNTQPQGFISYKVDGVAKRLSTTAYYSTDNSILVYGYGTGGESISLYIFTHTKTGDFQFANDVDSALAIYKPGGFVSNSGKLTINSFDGRHINGSFEFRGSNSRLTKNITDGQFTSTVLNFSEVVFPPGFDTAANAITHNKIHAPKIKSVY